MESKKNAGFTMIEILVVIAIMAIVATGATIGLNLLDNGNVTSVAENINSTMDTVRTQNMTKDRLIYMHLSANSDGEYFLKNSDSDTFDLSDVGDKLGSKKVNIYYIQNGANVLIESGKYIIIEFKRDGSIRYTSNGAALSGVTGLYITNGGRNATLKMVADTGKHFLE